MLYEVITSEDPSVMTDFLQSQGIDLLLCECGDCQRLPLDTCGCSWAENMRAEIRAKMARGSDYTFLELEPLTGRTP